MPMLEDLETPYGPEMMLIDELADLVDTALSGGLSRAPAPLALPEAPRPNFVTKRNFGVPFCLLIPPNDA